MSIQQKKAKTAIVPTREEDYPEWYQQVVKAADLAENSSVRGCMVIKPWGYGIWESIQQILDLSIKRLGHDNLYFPLFIPLSFFEKEAEHVQGFAKECAVVTHHRLEEKDGKLLPASPLEEPLVVRPTSETIIGDAFSKWVHSYRDLPLLMNQWANVVRWEMRTRLFLRTAEFLWQEGHTVHASEKEAIDHTLKILEMYQRFAEDVLAMPVVVGEKSESERFPGADRTYCIEAMMQDRKALQAGTSHYLGQNFSKASNIQFSNKEGALEYGYTTSWGVSTRLIGGVIMTHSDDDGLRLPPKIAPKQVVILPVIPKEENREAVLAYANQIKERLEKLFFHQRALITVIDTREMRGGAKNWDWIKKGIPIRLEVGPKDIEKENIVMMRRDKSAKDKDFIALDQVEERVLEALDQIQDNYFMQAKQLLDENTHVLEDFEQFKAFFTPKNLKKPEIHGGFVRAKWSKDPESEKLLEELKVTVRCIPLDQSHTQGTCILTGKPATIEAIFAKSY